MTASRVLRISGLAIAVGAVMLALVPFRADLAVHGGGLSQLHLVSRCGWPVGEAMRKETGGTFGFTSAGKGEVTVPGHMGCARKARHRLGLSVAGLALALLLVGVAVVLARRRGSDGDAGPLLAN